MFVTKVGLSERQYFTDGNSTAYITINSSNGFNVYICRCNGCSQFVKTYKTLAGAQKMLTNFGYVERMS